MTDRSPAPGSGSRAHRPASGPTGVMGGTFDPVHMGHLAVAEEAREALGLSRVLFVPAGVPPHKPDGAEASAADRVAMVELAIAGNPAFAMSRVDVDRPGPSYTSDTIALLATEAAGSERSADLVLILSAETLAGLPSWHDPRGLVEQCRVAVVPREGHPAPEPAWLAATFPGLEERFVMLDGPRLGISSTAIRARVAAGRSIRYLVPEAVGAYIADHGLYIDAQPGGTRRT